MAVYDDAARTVFMAHLEYNTRLGATVNLRLKAAHDDLTEATERARLDAIMAGYEFAESRVEFFEKVQDQTEVQVVLTYRRTRTAEQMEALTRISPFVRPAYLLISLLLAPLLAILTVFVLGLGYSSLWLCLTVLALFAIETVTMTTVFVVTAMRQERRNAPELKD